MIMAHLAPQQSPAPSCVFFSQLRGIVEKRKGALKWCGLSPNSVLELGGVVNQGDVTRDGRKITSWWLNQPI